MADRARALVAALAAGPREAGTPEAAAARDAVAAFLRDAGYDVELQPFRFAPSVLNAAAIVGGGLGGLGSLTLPLLVLPVWEKAAIVAWLLGLAAVAAIGMGVGLGWTTLGAELREDANIIARRPGADVRLWLVAHLDTKAQRQSMAGRLVAVWVAGAAMLLTTGLALARVLAPVPLWAAATASLLAITAGALLARGTLYGASAGARDNASGLLAVLTAAERSAAPGLGILVTSAEEFGLVGSRVFAQQCPELLSGREVLNLDTVDDRGTLHVVFHEKRGKALAQHLEPALRSLELPLRARRLPAGIMVDSLPLAPLSARAVTVARLDWSTLRVLHTPRDTADGFAFETAARLGRLLARAIDPEAPRR